VGTIYAALDAPPPGAMARPRSPSLFHTVTEHPAMLFVAMFVAASDVTGFMFSGRVFGSLPETSGRRSCKAPGCLKSESEERETWTAESLRAASSNGEGIGFKRPGLFPGEMRSWKRLRRSYVSRFSTSADCASGRTCRDLVKRCDQPRSVLSNLRV